MSCSLGILGNFIIGYWYIYPRGIIHYEQSFHFTSVIFGLLHGLAEAFFMLSIYACIEQLNWERWMVALLTIFVYWALKTIWEIFYWNKYIGPLHNTQDNQTQNLFLVFLPNTVITVAYFIIFGCVYMIVIFYVVAMIGVNVRLHFPRPEMDY